MNSKYKYCKKLLKSLHKDEDATGTVEWMMLITVALTVLVAIYYVVRWAMQNTSDAVKSVEGN